MPHSALASRRPSSQPSSHHPSSRRPWRLSSRRPSSRRLSWRLSFHPSLQPFSLPVDGMVGNDFPRRCADFPYENRPPSRAKGIIIGVGRNRENAFFPYENRRFSL